MSEIDVLIERCERATGPDRELDASVLSALTDFRELSHNYFEMNDWYYSLDGDEKNPAYPSPTASLDAVLALIERRFPVNALTMFSDASGCGATLVVWPNGLSCADETRTEAVAQSLSQACLLATLRAVKGLGDE